MTYPQTAMELRRGRLFEALRPILFDTPTELLRIMTDYCIVDTLFDAMEIPVEFGMTTDRCIFFRWRGRTSSWGSVFGRDRLRDRIGFVATVRWAHHCTPIHN